MLRQGPKQLLHMLDFLSARQVGWPLLLHEDLQWVMAHALKGEVPGTGRMEQWITMARAQPSRFAAVVTATAWRSLLSSQERVRTQVFRDILGEMGVKGEPTQGTAAVQAHVYFCYECGHTEHTQRGLRVHIAKVHRAWHQPEAYAVGTVCQSCCKDFREYNRLIAHLKRVPRCNQRWLATGRRGSLEELEMWRAEGAKMQQINRRACRHENAAAEPEVRVHGPSFCTQKLAVLPGPIFCPQVPVTAGGGVAQEVQEDRTCGICPQVFDPSFR